MKKLIFIFLLLFAGTSQAQLQNLLQALTTDSVEVLAGRPTPSTAFYDGIFLKTLASIDSIMSSLQKYGLNDGNYSTLASAVSAASTDTSNLVISKRHNITANTTVSGQLSLTVLPQGRFNISSGDTLTISVPFQAGLYEVFEGLGVVQFTDGSADIVDVEWFGSGQSGVNKAIQSLTSSGGNVRFSKAITITDSILINKNNVHFYGSGNRGGDIGVNIPSAYISVSSGSSDGVVVTGGNCLLENFTLDGLAATNGDDGIRLESLSTLRQLQILRMGGNGIRMGQDSNNMNGWILENIFAFNNDSNGVYIHHSAGAPDVNAGVAFYLYCKSNGLDGLRVENAIDNQFYMYRGDTNTGYGIRLKSGAKGNYFSFPYLEANTIGTGIIKSGALQNFVFGTRQGTSDGWVVEDATNDNIIMGRENTWNDRYQIRGNIAFKNLYTDSSAVFGKETTGGLNHTVTVNSGAGGISNGLILNNPIATVASRGTKLQWQNDEIEIANIQASGDGSATADGRIIFQTALSNSLTERMRLDKNGLLSINGTVNFAADAQADDDYEIAISNISALATGLKVTFTANTANTGAATLEITSVGLLDAILKKHDQALITGDIEAGQVVECVFDGTNWQMTSQLAQ